MLVWKCQYRIGRIVHHDLFHASGIIFRSFKIQSYLPFPHINLIIPLDIPGVIILYKLEYKVTKKEDVWIVCILKSMALLQSKV
jgi:hypothetical protein